MTSADPYGIDLDDAREASIASLLGGEVAVLWRRDIEWPSGEVTERHVAGLAAAEEGPRLFLASSWITWGTEINTRLHASVPVELVCTARLPDSGPFAARAFASERDRFDAEVEARLWRGARWLGRTANNSDGVYLARSRGTDGYVLHVLTVSGREGTPGAVTEWTATADVLARLAEREFGKAEQSAGLPLFGR